VKCNYPKCNEEGLFFFIAFLGWLCAAHYNEMIQKKINQKLQEASKEIANLTEDSKEKNHG